MTIEDEIRTIEYTLKNIFNKDVIKSIDVAVANNLFEKWKKLTGYVEDSNHPISDYIIDEEPNWKINK